VTLLKVVIVQRSNKHESGADPQTSKPKGAGGRAPNAEEAFTNLSKKITHFYAYFELNFTLKSQLYLRYCKVC